MIEFKKQAAANVELPNLGNVVLFLDVLDGFYKTKDDAGLVKVLGRGISNIARTSGNGAAGTVDVYTITVDGGATYTFSVTNGANGANGAAVQVQDEGVTLTSNASNLNFVGPGVTATNSGGNVTVTINGGNAFGVVTGNSGTANADSAGDSLALTGSNGITTNATDTPDGVVISPTYGSPVGLDGSSSTSDGSNSTFSRSNHTHAISNGGAPAALGASANQGTSTSLARSDHVHLNPVIAHEAAGDPHPQYTTVAEAGAAAPVQTVNGQTGNVTIVAGTDNTAVTRSSAIGGITTTPTVVQTFTPVVGANIAGSSFYFFASMRVVNTTTAANLVAAITIGAGDVLVLTQALGTTANAAPGRNISMEGFLTFANTTQVEASIRVFTSNAVAFDTEVSATGVINVTQDGALNIRVNTSGATANITVRQATIMRIK